MSLSLPELAFWLGVFGIFILVLETLNVWIATLSTGLYCILALAAWAYSPYRLRVIPMTTGTEVVKDDDWGF